MITIQWYVHPEGHHTGKQYLPDGKSISYDMRTAPKVWNHKLGQYETTDAFFGAIQRAGSKGCMFPIRGRTRPDVGHLANRRMREDADHPDLVPDVVPHECRWVMFDFDDEISPKHLGTHKARWAALNTEERTEQAQTYVTRKIIPRLPKWAQGSKMLIHLGSSWMIKKYSVHVWVVLDRPVSTKWLRSEVVSCGADRAVINLVQPHFVADPIFHAVEDPCKGMNRWWTIDGQECAVVPRNASAWVEHMEVAEEPLPALVLPADHDWSPIGQVTMDGIARIAQNRPEHPHTESKRSLWRIKTLIESGDLDSRSINHWFAIWQRTGMVDRRQLTRTINYILGVDLS